MFKQIVNTKEIFFKFKKVLLNKSAKIMHPFSLRSFTSCSITGFLSLSVGLLFCRNCISKCLLLLWRMLKPGFSDWRVSHFCLYTLLFRSPDRNSITTSFRQGGLFPSWEAVSKWQLPVAVKTWAKDREVSRPLVNLTAPAICGAQIKTSLSHSLVTGKTITRERGA